MSLQRYGKILTYANLCAKNSNMLQKRLPFIRGNLFLFCYLRLATTWRSIGISLAFFYQHNFCIRVVIFVYGSAIVQDRVEPCYDDRVLTIGSIVALVYI